MNLKQVYNLLGEDAFVILPIIFAKVIETVVIMLAAVLIIKFGTLAIKKFFDRQKNFKYPLDSRRIDTLGSLLSSIFRYFIYTIAILTIANSIFNINISTILAAAGIGGIAIGFGAQSLVKDVISGFFILLEDQFGVGDTITIDGLTGTVEEMEMRITKLRHFGGDLFIIPNGEIKKVINHSRGNKAAIVDIRVSYEENLDKVIEILKKTVEEAYNEIEGMVEKPTVLGVTDLTPTDVTIRTIVKCEQDKNFEIERYLRKRIKEVFDREGIVIPYTKKIIVNGKSEDGK